MAIMLNKENFQNEVMEAKDPVIIDFFANWCAPCRMLLPIIEDLSKEANGYKVCKVNVDEEREIASKFGIMSIPTLIVMKDGKIYNKAVGFRSKVDILDMVK